MSCKLDGEALSMSHLSELALILDIDEESFYKDLMQPLLRAALTKAYVPAHCVVVVCSWLVPGSCSSSKPGFLE